MAQVTLEMSGGASSAKIAMTSPVAAEMGAGEYKVGAPCRKGRPLVRAGGLSLQVVVLGCCAAAPHRAAKLACSMVAARMPSAKRVLLPAPVLHRCPGVFHHAKRVHQGNAAQAG